MVLLCVSGKYHACSAGHGMNSASSSGSYRCDDEDIVQLASPTGAEAYPACETRQLCIVSQSLASQFVLPSLLKAMVSP